MAQYIMNQDRCMYPRPVTFIAPVDGLYRGLVVKVVGMAANNYWLVDNGDDFEAYKVELAKAGDEKKDLLIHTTVPKMYDERLDERDFVANKDAVCRGHYLTTGDEYTLPQDFVANSATANVGDEVALDADGKLVVGSGDAIGEVVRVYTWNGQPSVMIRIY